MSLDPTRPSATSLIGECIESETQPGVRYRLERAVGEGGMGTAYLALRQTREGEAPVVIKVMNNAISEHGVAPELVAMKEAVSLGRLNESVPPSPFVVRLVDAGTLQRHNQRAVPWTALEYVHGGVEGTTLEDRVGYAVHRTGYAFDSTRAAHAVRCLAAGLSAIHAAGILHRDLAPGNVLCCGFGESEIFKISDFGVARATGLDRTFDGLNVGTIGYTAPESGAPSAGPAADVFSLAAVIYYMLTGQHYFPAATPVAALRLFTSELRPSIMAQPTLCPELLERPRVCQQVDGALARATTFASAERTHNPTDLANAVLAALVEPGSGPRSSARLLSAVLSSAGSATKPAEATHESYRWVTRCHPRDDFAIRSVAWDADGHALALLNGGAAFWNGNTWLDARSILDRAPVGVRFVQRHEAGGWLLGGDGGALVLVDSTGIAARVDAPDPTLSLCLASGRLGDLLVAVCTRPGDPAALLPLIGRRWLKPLALPEVAHVSSLQRLDDSRWLVGGRRERGGGFAAIYSPLEHSLREVSTPPVRAFITGASAFERSLALLAASDGVVLRVDRETVETSIVDPEVDLAAAAVDILDRQWAGSIGALWSRDRARGGPWRKLWSDPNSRAPFVSLMADAGSVIGVAADGAIIEGRASGEGS